jgi:hypothetical protein
MENKMKKLIALFATTAVASGSAMGAIALSGSASVSYDDNGSSPSATTYDADLSIVGTAGATTYTTSFDIDGGTDASAKDMAMTGATLATTIGPVTISADMYDEDDSATVSTTGGLSVDSGDNRSVTVSLDAPIGDATIGLDDTGDVTVTGTFSGVTVAHTVQDGADTTTGSASIAGMDITLSNDAGSTTWTIGTTVAGTAVTVGSDKSVSATFGVTGNTVVVKHVAERASAASTTSTKYSTGQKDAYTTIAVSRDLTSGAADDMAMTGATLATTIGPVTISADMYDEDDSATVSTTGGLSVDSGDNRSVTVSLDAPVGDATIGLDDTGDVTVTGTFSGVTVAHTMQDGADTTTGSASIAGMDITLSNDAGSTTWTIGTTVAGTAVTVGSDKSVSATFGVTGNTVVVKHVSERASAASTTSTKYSTAQKDAYTTIAVSRDLTSGAALAATYNTFDSSLTLKASVAF